MPKRNLNFSLALLLCALSHPAIADTVFLTNGDKITGEIKALDEQNLVIKPSYAPKITIERSAVRSFETRESQHWSINRSIEEVTIQASDLESFVIINQRQIPISELIYSETLNQSEWRYSGSAEAAIDVTDNSKFPPNDTAPVTRQSASGKSIQHRRVYLRSSNTHHAPSPILAAWL
ncbi:hypothetical protein Shewmr4_0114 [Shewanella sp. MR-4]|nr:hypothetical protein Shewmr4_0114 [Shewanella sp. MR-4]